MNTEEVLREGLHRHAEQLVYPAGDPWVRVDRAHRRSRAHRRTLAAGALAALVAGGVAVTLTPWSPSHGPAQPADRSADRQLGDLATTWLDDGRPRGELGDDPNLREAAAATVRREIAANGGRLAENHGVDLLYAGAPGGSPLALARAVTRTADQVYWMAGIGSTTLRVFSTSPTNLGAPAMTYTDADGDRRVLGVVPRGGRISAGRVTIDADGRAHRTWSAVRNDDGVVDVPVGDARTKGPVVVRVKYGQEVAYSDPQGLATPGADGVSPVPASAAQVQQALAGAPGSGVEPRIAAAAVNGLLRAAGATADVEQPKVLWAGRITGEDRIVAVAAGLPGQGRLLRITQYPPGTNDPWWTYTTTIPAQGPIGALGWRITVPTGNDVVGWLFDTFPGSGARLTVDGRERTAPLHDGLGTTEVGVDQKVEVADRAHGTHLALGPEARDEGSSPYAPGR
jgi:hypothetical protein